MPAEKKSKNCFWNFGQYNQVKDYSPNLHAIDREQELAIKRCPGFFQKPGLFFISLAKIAAYRLEGLQGAGRLHQIVPAIAHQV
jgi:hypothetical protein